jgi:molybdate transport system substrate-binding protein
MQIRSFMLHGAAILAAVTTLTSRAARAEPATLTVLAAASLKAPLERAAADFERAHPDVHVAISTAASGVLTQQIEHGAPADVFISAAQGPVDDLAAKKLVGPSQVLARNHLVLAAPKKSNAELKSLTDLLRPEFKRIGVGLAKTVPAGQYALQSLDKLQLTAQLQERFVFGESVSQVLSYLRNGDVDAGFVYASDAQGADASVRVLLQVDDSLHSPIVYPAAVISRSAQPDRAKSFLEFLAGAQGQARLHDAGLLPP